MLRPFIAAIPAAVALCLSSLGVAQTPGVAPSAVAASPAPGVTAEHAASPAASRSGVSHRHVAVCDHASAPRGTASCDAVRDELVDAMGHSVSRNVAPSGYAPSDLRSAYNLGSTSSGGKWVAIVDAYDDPYAERDLGVYRSQFVLPACTTSNGCFRKVSQTGSTRSLPRADGGWAQEISLDLDMVSATCPDCKILLVEARSTSFTDLAAAVAYAAGQHVSAISNSYGGSDASGNSSIGAAYDQPGIAVTASTGDNGYGVSSPASFPGVVAVGGTSLSRATTVRGWAETAWSGAGSGCSTLNPAPTFQTGTSCPNGKATADVSAVADPSTGVAVYDSWAYQGYSGWMVFGGTSAASPIVASVFALAHNVPTAGAESLPWAHASALNDVTSGSNGSATTSVWSNSGTGWDGPTGLGTPNGLGAF